MSDYQRKQSQKKRQRHQRAHQRVRQRVKGSPERPRLAVYKSLRYVYAQLIDDVAGRTIVQANSLESEIREAPVGSVAGRAAARKVGEVLAARAMAKGVNVVVFDRGGFIYHGCVREVAEGARDKGLVF